MRKPANADKTGKRNQALQVPLLYAFREAAEAGDSRKPDVGYDSDGARVLSQRSSIRRRGSNEVALKRNLNIDLGHLVNTINLASVIELDDYPMVRKSVLNYGIDDLTHLTTDASGLQDLGAALRVALTAHEPRLVAETLNITQNEATDETSQRIAFRANAEMKCRPVDIPLEFLAEIDVGSGKVELQDIAGTAQSRPPAPKPPGNG